MEMTDEGGFQLRESGLEFGQFGKERQSGRIMEAKDPTGIVRKTLEGFSELLNLRLARFFPERNLFRSNSGRKTGRATSVEVSPIRCTCPRV